MFVQGAPAGNQIHNGLGVGLSVVRRLVELHGGSVRAISDGRSGSEFVVDLPLGAGSVTAEEDTHAQTAMVIPKRILIIDDNADAAEALGMLLGLEGHQVETRLNGASGIAALTNFRPDIVLLDIGLPDMDGYEVARRLRNDESGRGVGLVAVTGYGLPTDRIRSAEAGFDHHLTKPVDPQTLIRLFGA